MKHFRTKLTITLFLYLQAYGISAQISKGELTEGKATLSEVNSMEKHQFILKLDKNQFAFLKLMQQGVDLAITIYDAEGEKIEDIDSPNGRHGPELFTLTSTKKGDYLIEVYPIDEDQFQGKYELSIVKIKPKAITPNDKVDELFTPWDSNETPGAAVAIVRDGAIIYKNGYGMANLEYDIPISPKSIFHIASVSKQFTAFSILLLEQDGKLKLDDDIRKYIPEVPDFGKTITLRHLVHHTSGLRDQWNLLAMAGWRLDDVITTEQILKLIGNQKELNFEPGDEYLYCNTGFTLLAEVVAQVSGKSFAVFTKERIFDPLNMTNTLFYDDHQKIVKNRTYSYYMDSTGYKKSVLSYATVGATSLFTSVEDLSRWSLNFETTEIGNLTIIEKMNTRGILNSGDTISYALGQVIGKYKGVKRIAHGGGDAGYRTYLGRFPDQKFSVIAFSNDAGFSSGSMAMKIVDIFLEDDLVKEEREEKKESESNIYIDPDTLKAYVGDFELQTGFILVISYEQEKLFVQGTGQSKLSLEPISTTEFKVENVEAKVSFHRDGENEINLIKLHQGGQISDAPRMESFDGESVNLSEYTGEYYSDELSNTYNFIIDDDKLVARHYRHSDIELTPTKSDAFSGNIWFFRQIEMVRDDSNSIIGCKVSNGRVRNLFFKKIE